MIFQREHLLPLCDECFKGMEDYEGFVEKSLNNIHINIDKKPLIKNDFLRV